VPISKTAPAARANAMTFAKRGILRSGYLDCQLYGKMSDSAEHGRQLTSRPQSAFHPLLLNGSKRENSLGRHNQLMWSNSGISEMERDGEASSLKSWKVLCTAPGRSAVWKLNSLMDSPPQLRLSRPHQAPAAPKRRSRRHRG
jgi:hypothetical protein